VDGIGYVLISTPRPLQFSFSGFGTAPSSVASGWTLHVGSDPFAFSAGTYTALVSTWAWSLATAPWSDGDNVTVALSGAAAPTVANAIPDQTATVGTAFSYQFPADTFNFIDTGVLTYTAAQADDSALPSWLTFTAGTRTFSGTPGSSDAGTLSVKVTATHGSNSVSDTFDIDVVAPPPPGLTFSTTRVNVREGSTATYTVKLDKQPTHPLIELVEVEVALASGDTGAVTVSPTPLTFTSATWNDAQTVTVTAVEDDDTQHETVTVTHSGTGVTAGTVTVRVSDDEAPNPDPDPTGPPTPPRSLEATAGDREVLLAWEAPTTDGGSRIARYEYRLKRGDGGFLTWRSIRDREGESHVRTRRHLVTELTNGTTCTFELRAVNNSGFRSPPSEPASATPEETVRVPALPLIGQLALALLLAAGGLVRRRHAAGA